MARTGRADLTGERFGRLVVVGRATDSPNGFAKWHCRCDCGGKATAFQSNLRKPGHTTSCGCRSRELIAKVNLKHGMSDSPEFRCWSHMRGRCYDRGDKAYAYYGGRGIQVDPEWRTSFEAFYRDMGPRPSSGHSIDRINNDGDYRPENCRWSTLLEQRQNRQDTVRLTHNGRTLAVSAWARELGISPYTIYWRVKAGWSDERIVATPSARKR